MAENNKYRIQLKDLNGSLMFPNTTVKQVEGLEATINAAIADSLKTTAVMSFQGTVSSTVGLPEVAFRGFTYMVAEAGTYAGQECEIGDLIICTGNNSVEGSAPTEAYWTVVQTNLTGAISGSFGNNSDEYGKLVLTSGEHAIETLEGNIGSEYAGVYVVNGKLKGTTQTYAAFQVAVEDENTLSISVFDYDPAKGFAPVDVDKKVTGTITSPDKSLNIAWAKDGDGNDDIHKVEITLGTAVTDRINYVEDAVLQLAHFEETFQDTVMVPFAEQVSEQITAIGTCIDDLTERVDDVEAKIDSKIAESAQGGSAYGNIAGLQAGNSSDSLKISVGTGIVISTSATIATGTRLVDGMEIQYEYQKDQTISLGLKLSTGLEFDESGALTISSSLGGLQEVVDGLADGLVEKDAEGNQTGLIKLGTDGKLTLDTGLLLKEKSGLTVDETSGKIGLAVGPGLEVDETSGNVGIAVGSGVGIVDNKVEIKLSTGMQFNADGAICATLFYDIEETIE